jgi:hypothetical protein
MVLFYVALILLHLRTSHSHHVGTIHSNIFKNAKIWRPFVTWRSYQVSWRSVNLFKRHKDTPTWLYNEISDSSGGEDGDSMFIRNIGIYLRGHTASQPRTSTWQFCIIIFTCRIRKVGYKLLSKVCYLICDIQMLISECKHLRDSMRYCSAGNSLFAKMRIVMWREMKLFIQKNAKVLLCDLSILFIRRQPEASGLSQVDSHWPLLEYTCDFHKRFFNVYCGLVIEDTRRFARRATVFFWRCRQIEITRRALHTSVNVTRCCRLHVCRRVVQV